MADISNISRLTVRELWNMFYDNETLDRIDLGQEWKIVEEYGDWQIHPFLTNQYIGISEDSLTMILRIINTILDLNVSSNERSLLFFNLVPILKRCLEEEDFMTLCHLKGVVENVDQGNREFRQFPKKALIELTNSCNLNCVMCGVGAEGFKPERTMSLRDFRNLVRTLDGRVESIRLNGLGESTVIPNFLEYLDIVERNNLKLEIVTNLSFDNPLILERLLNMETLIFVSCDSTMRKDLLSIRRGLDYDIFIRNLELISDYFRHARKDNGNCHIIMTLMESNFRELPAMIDFAHRYDIGGVIGNMLKGRNGKWKMENMESIKEIFKKAADRAEKHDILLKVPNQIEGVRLCNDFASESNAFECNSYLEEMFIRFNGDVCPCNMMNPYVYGNLGREPIGNILCGANAQVFHSLVNTRSRHPYCVNCYYMR